MHNSSEVVQLMEQIDGEINAMQQITNGFSSVARHEIISQRFACLDRCFQQLSVRVGEQCALEIIAQKMEERI